MSTSLYFLGLYNVVTNGLKVAANVSSDLLNAVCNYLNGTSDEWYFFENTGPIPASAYNIPYSSYRNRIQFTYNRYKNTLIQEQDGIQSDGIRFNFLSTQLIADGKAYTMDDWIKYLVISVADYDALSVRILVDAWSIYHCIWPDDNAELHIIDSEGQSHTFHINDPVSDAWIALLPFEKEEELTEDDEEEEEEEMEETEEEEEEAAVEPPSTPVLEATVTEMPDVPAISVEPTPDVPETSVEPTPDVPETSVEPTPDVPETSVEPPASSDAPLETVTVTLDSLANIDVAHLSGV
jgi:hypothetical protein